MGGEGQASHIPSTLVYLVVCTTELVTIALYRLDGPVISWDFTLSILSVFDLAHTISYAMISTAFSGLQVRYLAMLPEELSWRAIVTIFK
jgi:hypothetical protein